MVAGDHSVPRMILIILTCLVLIATLIMNMLSGFLDSVDIGLFVSSTTNVSDKYYTQITPAGWTFSIWGAIYIYQLIFMIYALSTICTNTENGYVYTQNFIHPAVYLIYILNLGCNITWLFMFDREYLELSLGFLAGITFTLYLCIGITMHGIATYGKKMMDIGHRGQVVAAIAIVLNGLATYATWCSIATLLNLNIVLAYVLDIQLHIASAIALGALALDIVVYALIDLVLFERHFRYVYTPYVVLAVALTGSLDKNWDSANSNTIFTLAIACMAAILFCVKFVMSIIRSRTHPIL